MNPAIKKQGDSICFCFLDLFLKEITRAVSYTPLTLQTKAEVWTSVGSITFMKK